MRVSISILSPVLQNKGTITSKPVLILAGFITYFYTLSEFVDEDDAEGWYWESEAAVDWMNSFAMENDSIFYVDDNCLYFDEDYAEMSIED